MKRSTIPQLRQALQYLVDLDTVNAEKLRALGDSTGAEALLTRRDAFQDALKLLDGAPLEEVSQFDNLALAALTPPTPDAPASSGNADSPCPDAISQVG